MNTHDITPNSPAASPAFDTARSIGRKGLAIALAYLMVPLGISDIYAQTAPPPPPDQGQYQQAPPPPDQGQYQDQYGQDNQNQYGNQDQYGNYDQGPPPQTYYALSPEQLDRLVAPIALYPDALVAQILAASTYPDEVAAADNFLRANQGLPPDELGNMANDTNWDPSVKSLIAFPSVLDNLASNMDWTSQLGNAYYNQPQDVMNSIQDMRARAYAAGNLRSGPQIVVDYNPGVIVIAPANPNVYYVPWYNPWVVYGAPLVAWGGYYPPPRPVGFYVAAGVAFGFGIGIAVATWNRWGWGCHHWGMGWRDRTVVYQQNIYISRSVRVINHGYYGRFDRDREARHYNMQVARRAPNFHPVGNRRPDVFNRQTRQFVRQPQQKLNQNFRRPQQLNRATQPNRPGSFARPAQQNRNFNRPQPQQYRPQNNTRPAQQNRQPFNRQQNFNRPQNNARPPQQNRQQFNRPQPQQYNRPRQRPQQYNRPQPQQYRPQPQQQQYNRPQQRPQQYNRPQPQQYNRPQPQQYNRPQPQQYRPQARPEPNRPQPRPQQARPQNHGHVENPNHGHRR